MQCIYNELIIFVITVVLQCLKSADVVVMWQSECVGAVSLHVIAPVSAFLLWLPCISLPQGAISVVLHCLVPSVVAFCRKQ